MHKEIYTEKQFWTSKLIFFGIGLYYSNPINKKWFWIFNKRAKRRMTSAAELALLQTPPVKRKTPRRKPLSPDLTATPSTPHSILKVRHKPLRRSPSPQIFAQTVKTQQPGNVSRSGWFDKMIVDVVHYRFIYVSHWIKRIRAIKLNKTKHL